MIIVRGTDIGLKDTHSFTQRPCSSCGKVRWVRVDSKKENCFSCSHRTANFRSKLSQSKMGKLPPSYIDGRTKTRLYNVWTLMKQRCNNPNSKCYPNYGGRGITIYSKWNSFDGFREWALANGYQETLTLDRINNAGNYEPNNCRFVTLGENACKDKRQKVCQFTLKGDYIQSFPSINEAARQTNVSTGSIWSACVGIYKTAGGFIWRKGKDGKS